MLWSSPSENPLLSSGRQRTVSVGLVNNMSDGALKTTERQFKYLLSAGGPQYSVKLNIYSLPNVKRSQEATRHIVMNYRKLDELWESDLDGLIVTGAEPQSASLKDEAYWCDFRKIIEWADNNTASCIWSCLAAQAAVLHFDNIDRQRFEKKLTGLFHSRIREQDTIIEECPRHWQIPHSRYNGLSADALINRGYNIIVEGRQTGPDLFVKKMGARHIFMQGHIEYDFDTLFREYRRDVRRFLAGERDEYPDLPCGYFDRSKKDTMERFREQALRDRRLGLMTDFPQLPTVETPSPWAAVALRLYRNWLRCLSERKDQVPILSGVTSNIDLRDGKRETTVV